GLDVPRGVKLDLKKQIFVFGSTTSRDFPMVNPIQKKFGGEGAFGKGDGFWVVVNPAGSKVLFSTYQGGNKDDSTDSLSISRIDGDVYSTTASYSTNFHAASTKMKSDDIRCHMVVQAYESDENGRWKIRVGVDQDDVNRDPKCEGLEFLIETLIARSKAN